MSGILYLVATPIGNLEDLTLRARRVLAEVDLIACEDTRHTRRLLSHYDISRPLVSYHEHNERERAGELVDKLDRGLNVALVSDAGTPLVSDPGHRLVGAAIAKGIRVVPIPGPAAALAALVAAGLPTDRFLFAGFLPPKAKARRERFTEVSAVDATLVFYEAPHRIRQTLADALAVLGDRPAVVARELTKVHEEFIRGSLSRLVGLVTEEKSRGEMVLLIGGPGLLEPGATGGTVAPAAVRSLVEQIIRDAGVDRKTALKRAAKQLGVSRSEAYRMMLAEGGET